MVHHLLEFKVSSILWSRDTQTQERKCEVHWARDIILL